MSGSTSRRGRAAAGILTGLFAIVGALTLLGIVITVIPFVEFNLQPGGPCYDILANPRPDAATVYNRCRADWGLDQPVPVEYVKWLAHQL